MPDSNSSTRSDARGLTDSTLCSKPLGLRFGLALRRFPITPASSARVLVLRRVGSEPALHAASKARDETADFLGFIVASREEAF